MKEHKGSSVARGVRMRYAVYSGRKDKTYTGLKKATSKLARKVRSSARRCLLQARNTSKAASSKRGERLVPRRGRSSILSVLLPWIPRLKDVLCMRRQWPSTQVQFDGICFFFAPNVHSLSCTEGPAAQQTQFDSLFVEVCRCMLKRVREATRMGILVSFVTSGSLLHWISHKK